MNHFYSDKSLKNDADSGRLCRPVSVEDMMEARERRARLQEQLIGTYQVPVVSFTLNIPGFRANFIRDSAVGAHWTGAVSLRRREAGNPQADYLLS